MPKRDPDRCPHINNRVTSMPVMSLTDQHIVQHCRDCGRSRTTDRDGYWPTSWVDGTPRR